ncbi:CAP domain-containing protein [Pseudoneobacillus sp. C159]
MNFFQDKENEILIQNELIPSKNHQSNLIDKKNTNYSTSSRPKQGISTLIGKNINELQKQLGSPSRIDPSYFGYKWYIYHSDDSHYLQVGVENGKVVNAYVIGNEIDISPFKIGQPIEEIFSTVFIETEIDIELDDSSYRFELNDTDVNMRPLIQFENIFAELYFDKFSGTLSSIRFLDAESLIKHRPYELIYRGELLQPEEIQDDQWEKIEQATEQQIFDLTNILRERHEINKLQWDVELSRVAKGHSLDMYETKTFSHTSENYGELKDRLEAANVFYQLAGENIAAHYLDGPSVVVGWLNSKGHRETMLHKDYTHLGVGVYHKYYTQNFIQKQDE